MKNISGNTDKSQCRGFTDQIDPHPLSGQAIYTKSGKISDSDQKIVNKKHINLDNAESYIIGIAKNKIKRHYSSAKINYIEPENESLSQYSNNDIDIEKDLITKDNVMQVWNYLKNKSELTAKIFYLYYVIDVPIKEIAEELKLTEPNVKNHLYRTQKDLKERFKKGERHNVK